MARRATALLVPHHRVDEGHVGGGAPWPVPVRAAGSAFAHCDTTGGPIIPEAKAALEKGDVTPILKWVRKDNEAEIKAAFTKAVEAKTTKDKSVEAGRAFVEAYVAYMHYVEGIHTAIVSTGAHHAAGAGTTGHKD